VGGDFGFAFPGASGEQTEDGLAGTGQGNAAAGGGRRFRYGRMGFQGVAEVLLDFIGRHEVPLELIVRDVVELPVEASQYCHGVGFLSVYVMFGIQDSGFRIQDSGFRILEFGLEGVRLS
jgi:hypothetical protein